VTDSPVVSFEDEPLILVDSDDNILGYKNKKDCHDGDGILHRAFSIFIFNDDGELLLQQRSEQKRLWPMFWANTCCSHPRRGEETPDAANRRLQEELGLKASLSYRSNDSALLNKNEINELRYVSPEVLDQEMETSPEKFTPWLKLEWACLRRDHWHVVEGL
jgi:isopentenyl-diphosphate delta-isomerase